MTSAALVFSEIDKLAERVAKKSGDELWTNMGWRGKEDEIVTVGSTFSRNRRVTFIYGATRLVVYISISGKNYHYLGKHGHGKFLNTRMLRAWKNIIDLP